MMTLGVAVSQQDWSLHRKGPMDQARHAEKVKEAIRQNLADIISEQSIITGGGGKVIKVPVRSLEQYKFRYGEPPKGGQPGQGGGDTEVGDVIERLQPGPGKGGGAGEQPGIDYYEAEVTIDDLAALVCADLGLPYLEEKREQVLESETVEFSDIRRTGAFSNLDKRRTLRENIKRNAMRGHARVGDLQTSDLRFKTWEETVQRQSNAVVLAMMDISGSMGTFEKYCARAFYFWMVRFLRTKYGRVEIVFIAHHTEAKEVGEQEFFTRGESGGTKASSAYRLALEVVDRRYPAADWNIYPFHFSDGDNWPSDNEDCRKLAGELLARSNQLGYAEIRKGQAYGVTSTLKETLDSLARPKFVSVVIRETSDVWSALQAFFGKETLGSLTKKVT